MRIIKTKKTQVRIDLQALIRIEEIGQNVVLTVKDQQEELDIFMKPETYKYFSEKILSHRRRKLALNNKK